MSDFIVGKNRDAWFVIRGYKYQVDLSIIRWLSLTGSQHLLLELGEDIDQVNTVVSKNTGDLDRELEQVKHLDKSITLRSSACKIAVANAAQHFRLNPGKHLLFRFSTNTSVTVERPSPFEDKRAGISVWESIRKRKCTTSERASRLEKLLALLRSLKKPAEGIDSETWAEFRNFLADASLTDFEDFVLHFEWSTHQSGATDVSQEIHRLVEAETNVGAGKVMSVYPRLFLHVMQVLSRPGEKKLSKESLHDVIADLTSTDHETRMLEFLQTEILSQSRRIEEVAATTERHESAIANARQRILALEFGSVKSPSLSAAISEISIGLPPQVTTIAKRADLVSKFQVEISNRDWFAIYGSVGCGKTQLAALIGERLESIVYVSLRDLNAQESNFLLYHLFL